MSDLGHYKCKQLVVFCSPAGHMTWSRIQPQTIKVAGRHAMYFASQTS